MKESPNVITKFEALFTTRTGLTLLLPKLAVFDSPAEGFFFRKSDNPSDIIVYSSAGEITVKNLRKEHLDFSVEKGFIMFYETDKKDKVIRNTLCKYKA